jgi:hypothetical protein
VGGQIVSDDFYHDDPIEEKTTRKFRNNLLTPFALIIASVFFFQSTLAGNITLSSGSGIEFGQGVSQTVACSGSNNLMVTPYSSFVNSANSGGTYNFSSITVSGIPDSCNGAQFQINAYGNSSQSPLALYNSTSANVIVADTGESFRLDIGALGITLTVNSSSSFTVTFGTPVATSDAVFKLTIQSTTKSIQTTYSVGNTGPGGGRIFYYSADGFNCGPTHSATGSPTGDKCNYLEVAPKNWSAASDPTAYWTLITAEFTNTPGVTYFEDVGLASTGIGLGYKDSVAIVARGNGTNTAAGAARAYSGGSKNDWYLSSAVELNILCQWSRGIPSNITVFCNGGTPNSAAYGASASSAGFETASDRWYWSSTQIRDASYAFLLSFDGLTTAVESRNKNTFNYVRPIRAF